MTKALRNKIKDPGIINFRQLPTSVVSRCFLQHLLFDVCRIDSRNVRRSARFPRRGALQIEANRIQQNQEDPNLIFIFLKHRSSGLWFVDFLEGVLREPFQRNLERWEAFSFLSQLHRPLLQGYPKVLARLICSFCLSCVKRQVAHFPNKFKSDVIFHLLSFVFCGHVVWQRPKQYNHIETVVSRPRGARVGGASLW